MNSPLAPESRHRPIRQSLRARWPADTLTRALALALVLGLLGFVFLPGCGGGDDTPTTPSGPDTPAEYTARGWDRFGAGNFDGALADFNAALGLDADNGPALAGQGWARLALATTTTAMQNAVASFTSAAAAGEDGADELAGKAAAELGAGQWANAVTSAEAALVAAPGFVFSHRNSFTSDDLFLIIAFARAAQGDLDNALEAADAVDDSGIETGQPATWVVGGVTYQTFAAAVLAHLHALSESHSG